MQKRPKRQANNKQMTVQSTCQIRKVESQDLPEIIKLEQLCFKDPYSESLLSELAENDANTFLVAVLANEIVGYGVVSQQDSNHYHLLSIAVVPSHRRLGIAQQILESLQVRLESGLLNLELRQANHAALKLYRKNGFSETGVVRRYYRDGEDAITMEKSVS